MLFLWGPLDFRTWTIFIDWLLYILETTNDELGVHGEILQLDLLLGAEQVIHQ